LDGLIILVSIDLDVKFNFAKVIKKPHIKKQSDNKNSENQKSGFIPFFKNQKSGFIL
jgi:hypothetical protein